MRQKLLSKRVREVRHRYLDACGAVLALKPTRKAKAALEELLTATDALNNAIAEELRNVPFGRGRR